MRRFVCDSHPGSSDSRHAHKKAPGETVLIDFEYDSHVRRGQDVESVQITASVLAGSGPNCALVLGKPTVRSIGANVEVAGGMHDVLYKVACIATLADGRQVLRKLVLWVCDPAFVPVPPVAPDPETARPAERVQNGSKTGF